MRLAMLLAVGMALGGCRVASVGTQTTDNPNAKVEVVLTDKDGYTLKRVETSYQNFVYYVTPGPTRTAWKTTHSSGKTTYTVDHGVDTAE